MAPITITPLFAFLHARAYPLPGAASPGEAVQAASNELEICSDSASPIAVPEIGTAIITARDGASTYTAGAGSVPAASFNNSAYFALFAIIGAAMVVAALWFFFWAKNGGFHFHQGDWDDYKSTVLRRKGPDGKTLSNATKSTKLGGGSVVHGQQYKWQKQAARSVVGFDEKGRKGIMGRRGFAGTHSVTYSDDYMTETFGTKSASDDMTEINTLANSGAAPGAHSKRYKDRDVRQYKKEKPARVGGLNRMADGSHFDYTNSDRSDAYTDASEEPMLKKQQQHHQPARAGGRNAERERREAERTAKEEAARMERRWKKEAEAAAAALARENAPPPPPVHRSSRPAAPPSPSAAPLNPKTRRRSHSRSASPKKRDFSYRAGPASEVLSAGAHTDSSRSPSYYNAYRPRHAADGYSSDGASRSRQSSPRKGGRARESGYRRGADSDFD